MKHSFTSFIYHFHPCTYGERKVVSKIVSGIMLILLVLSVFSLLSYIQPVRASGTIYMMADGSVDPIHDIGVTSVLPYKTIVGQGSSLNVSVTAENPGDYTEAFNVTLYTENQAGLVGYWKFDEGAGTIASDSSGNNNNGTINGAVWTEGRISRGVQFDGIDDYVQVPDSTSLNIANDEISIAAWVKMLGDGTNNGVVVCKQAPAGTSDASYSLDVYPSIHTPVGRHVEFAVNVGGSWNAYVSTSALTLGAWNHVVGTYDGSKVRIFINGVLDIEYTLTGNIVPKNGPLYIGHEDAWSPGEYFNGAVDEVRVYNRTLSSAEIWAEYTSLEPGLVGYWKLDEGIGTTAYDSSGNGNDGTLVNGPTWVDGRFGKALSFDGVDNMVNAPNSSLWNFGTGDFTMGAWINTKDQAKTMRIASAGYGSNDTGSNLWTLGFGYNPGWGSGTRINYATKSGGYYRNFDSNSLTYNNNEYGHLFL
jgi:hypothetical protein